MARKEHIAGDWHIHVKHTCRWVDAHGLFGITLKRNIKISLSISL